MSRDMKLTRAERRAINDLYHLAYDSDYGDISLAEWIRIVRLPATRNNLREKGFVTSFSSRDDGVRVRLTPAGYRYVLGGVS